MPARGQAQTTSGTRPRVPNPDQNTQYSSGKSGMESNNHASSDQAPPRRLDRIPSAYA